MAFQTSAGTRVVVRLLVVRLQLLRESLLVSPLLCDLLVVDAEQARHFRRVARVFVLIGLALGGFVGFARFAAGFHPALPFFFAHDIDFDARAADGFCAGIGSCLDHFAGGFAVVAVEVAVGDDWDAEEYFTWVRRLAEAKANLDETFLKNDEHLKKVVYALNGVYHDKVTMALSNKYITILEPHQATAIIVRYMVAYHFFARFEFEETPEKSLVTRVQLHLVKMNVAMRDVDVATMLQAAADGVRFFASAPFPVRFAMNLAD
jgi:hypothetical protein